MMYQWCLIGWMHARSNQNRAAHSGTGMNGEVELVMEVKME